MGYSGVEGRVQGRIGHRPHHGPCQRRDVEERLPAGRPFGRVAGPHADDNADRLPVPFLGQERDRRALVEGEEGAELFRALPPCGPDRTSHTVSACSDGVDDDAGVDHVHGVQPVFQRGHDAEVPAAAAQRPEEVLVLGFTGRQELSVGGDDVGREEVVAAEPVLAVKVADATAEGQPGDPGRADDAARRRQPEGMRGVVEVRPRCTGLGARRSALPDRPGRRVVLTKSMTRASSHVPKPGALWPPPRTARSRALSRAKLTQAITSATWDTRTTAAGLLSIMPLLHCTRLVVVRVAGRDDLPADLLAQAIEVGSIHFLYRRFRRDFRPGRWFVLPAGMTPGGLRAQGLLLRPRPVKRSGPAPGQSAHAEHRTGTSARPIFLGHCSECPVDMSPANRGKCPPRRGKLELRALRPMVGIDGRDVEDTAWPDAR